MFIDLTADQRALRDELRAYFAALLTPAERAEQLQVLGPSLAEVVGRHGDPADPDTAALLTWLDVQLKRNTVLTFGGGVNEVQRELIATAGLHLPRAPR